MRRIPWNPCSIHLLNFGGNSQSTTSNTENVTQPTTTVSGGTGANAVSTTGAVTFNQESPQALNDVATAIQSNTQVSLAALQAGEATTNATTSLVGKTTATPTEQLTPIILGVAIVGAVAFWLANRKKT